MKGTERSLRRFWSNAKRSVIGSSLLMETVVTESKKQWRKPEVKSIVAGAAENKVNAGPDGAPGTHSTS